MIRKIALLACSSVALGGCAGSDSHPVYVSDAFTLDEQGRITEGVEFWNRATHGASPIDLVFNVKVDACACDRNVLVRLDNPSPCFPLSLKNPYETGETVQQGLCYTRIALLPHHNPGLDYLRVTVAHEFGHFLGLAHVTDPDALMAPSPPRSVEAHVSASCLVNSDAVEYCRVRDCQGVTFTGC